MYDILYYLVYHEEHETKRKLGCPYDWEIVVDIYEKLLSTSFDKNEFILQFSDILDNKNYKIREFRIDNYEELFRND